MSPMRRQRHGVPRTLKRLTIYFLLAAGWALNGCGCAKKPKAEQPLPPPVAAPSPSPAPAPGPKLENPILDLSKRK